MTDRKSLFGRHDDPTTWSYVQGICGEEMEFYLVIDGGHITDVRYYTDGCVASHACGQLAAELAMGRSITDAMNISAGQIITDIGNLPEDHQHCAILAVTSLYKALAKYLLEP